MKAQVYKDPRPAEYFDRFHERARTRDPDWVYEVVRIVLTPLLRCIFFRARCDRLGERAGDRPGDLRAEPLLLHGPLLRGDVHAPPRALHGQVAAVHTADAVDLHARRRVPGAPRPPRRGGVHHRRARSSTAARTIVDVLRGRALAHRRAVGQGQARHRPPGARDRRADRAGRDLRLPEGAQLEAAAVPEGDRAVRRADRRSSRVEDPTREQQQAVADEVFAAIRAPLRRPRAPRPQGHGPARARAAPRRAPRRAARRRRSQTAHFSPATASSVAGAG